MKQIKKQSGVVLVFVLLYLVLLTVMAGSFSNSMRGDAALVHHHKSQLEQSALANAGLAYTKFMLTQPQPARQWQGNAQRHKIDFDGHSLEITIQDESGKFDINVADKDMLLYLFNKILGGDKQIENLVDAVLDWRDADDNERVNGAETSGSYTAANRPFKNMRELQKVKGLTSEEMNKLALYFTTQTNQKKIDLSVAPEYILNILPGSDLTWVQEVLITRVNESQSSRHLLVPQSMTSYATRAASLRGQYLSITVIVNSSNENVVSTQVLVRRNAKRFYPLFSEFERNIQNIF